MADLHLSSAWMSCQVLTQLFDKPLIESLLLGKNYLQSNDLFFGHTF